MTAIRKMQVSELTPAGYNPRTITEAAEKTTTQHMKGGNTAEFYAKEGTLAKSQMQVKVHPDVSRLTWRFGRIHHYVDYRPFRANRLRLRPDVVIPDKPNEYGLELRQVRRDTANAT